MSPNKYFGSKSNCTMVISVLIFVNLTCFSQTAFENLQQYWYYRLRLLGNAELNEPGFLKTGTEAGKSLPASWRDKYRDHGFWPFLPYAPKPCCYFCGGCIFLELIHIGNACPV